MTDRTLLEKQNSDYGVQGKDSQLDLNIHTNNQNH